MRNKENKKIRHKRLNTYSINRLFATIVKVRMFGKYWLNGQDGYFYQVDSTAELINGQPNEYVGYRQPLQFVYRFMQAGYNIHGDKVCYRKGYYNSGSTPLVFSKRFTKR